jgi:hypothetical protein
MSDHGPYPDFFGSIARSTLARCANLPNVVFRFGDPSSINGLLPLEPQVRHPFVLRNNFRDPDRR